MWRCPSCGKQIEPEFEVCWNCGTAQDGTPAEIFFQAEPSDSDGSDPDSASEPPEEDADEAADDAARHERIVELCSAANEVEAQELCNVLWEEGIQARMVGDSLANAAGRLPFGETIAPRVWIRESDAARAREIIAQRFAETREELADWCESGETPEWEQPVEPEGSEIPSDRRFRFLSQSFGIAGFICVVLSMVWAWQNDVILSKYSATAYGRLVDYGYYSCYAYAVEREIYRTETKDARHAPVAATIYYDPHNPSDHLVGSIAPPWVVLVFGFGLGAFLVFVSYQFR